MKLSLSNVVAFLVGLSLGIAALYTLKSGSTWLQSSNPQVPKNSLLVIGLVTLLAASQWYSGARARPRITNTNEESTIDRPKLRRTPNIGTRIFVMQFSLAVWLAIFANHEGWTAESVGLESEWPAWLSLLVGLAVYGCFVGLLVISIKGAGLYDSVADNNMQVLARLWPRAAKERSYLLIGLCLLNPIVEELLFRGILVYQFSLALESKTLPILIGLVASLGNHAYQGRYAITTHLPFYVIVVTLLYSQAGLWGAIGFHFAGDWLPILSLRRALLEYRRRHRSPDWHPPPASTNQIS